MEERGDRIRPEPAATEGKRRLGAGGRNGLLACRCDVVRAPAGVEVRGLAPGDDPGSPGEIVEGKVLEADDEDPAWSAGEGFSSHRCFLWSRSKGREERGGAGRTGGLSVDGSGRIGSRSRPGGRPGEHEMRGFRRLAPLCTVQVFFRGESSSLFAFGKRLFNTRAGTGSFIQVVSL